MSGFQQAWRELDPAPRRCLELAYDALRCGGLAVGAVVTDPAGRIVAEGRNRAYDPPGGSDVLQGTPLAHAELNALAAVRTGWDLAEHTVWSTQEPCPMCAAALAFTGVDTVRFLARDPWALATGATGSAPAAALGPVGGVWDTLASVLFLHSVALAGGPDHPTVRRNLELAPAPARIAVGLLTAAGPRPPSLPDYAGPLWDRLLGAG
ncbi:nucleoside deaminase [Kitasatospora cinereorecta]|uniref:Nucleoside deaminase n=1 Tax=Kitasatospora cinereorecta TaxID=285560 RepID=A0ABW0VD54_9ACTN